VFALVKTSERREYLRQQGDSVVVVIDPLRGSLVERLVLFWSRGAQFKDASVCTGGDHHTMQQLSAVALD
jgi:hypothetical protein